ncbi:hypothetical protein F0562_010465 [Nyssa sinensis]|uniref:X8 domain-containing protein n=1 Tax=Nyssa sinensis TaxID=561372 RepID=A0A5J5A1P1_9ASTE|nr:hypothetical protein F0562_010465 [Nyssa sinensis]
MANNLFLIFLNHAPTIPLYGLHSSFMPVSRLFWLALMRAAFHSMEPRRNSMRLCILALYISISAPAHFTQCDARTLLQMFKFRGPQLQTSSVTGGSSPKRVQVSNQLEVNPPLHASNDEFYSLSSPFSLAPFESLPPLYLTENTPPFCAYPPIFTPTTTTMPSPVNHAPPPPPFTFPIGSPPPESSPPGLHEPVPNPPKYVPGPSPTRYVPSCPPEHIQPPPVPVVYPPPPPPPPPLYKAPDFAVWCVAKPTVPNRIIQDALDYACGSGADCESIQPNGSCFQPNTLIAHASYAFNSYWQRRKVGGGTCDFGGTAMLVTVDPSFDGCRFIYY